MSDCGCDSGGGDTGGGCDSGGGDTGGGCDSGGGFSSGGCDSGGGFSSGGCDTGGGDTNYDSGWMSHSNAHDTHINMHNMASDTDYATSAFTTGQSMFSHSDNDHYTSTYGDRKTGASSSSKGNRCVAGYRVVGNGRSRFSYNNRASRTIARKRLFNPTLESCYPCCGECFMAIFVLSTLAAIILIVLGFPWLKKHWD